MSGGHGDPHDGPDALVDGPPRPTMAEAAAPSARAAASEATEGAVTSAAVGDSAIEGIVDWQRTGRRVLTTGLVVAAVVVVAWLVAGLLGDGVRLADLGDWVGLGLGVMVVSEVVVVGGAAVRAERRAAVRGERLGSDDIGLLPPRIPRPSRRGDRD